jgi:hypothetical protein
MLSHKLTFVIDMRKNFILNSAVKKLTLLFLTTEYRFITLIHNKRYPKKVNYTLFGLFLCYLFVKEIRRYRIFP